MLEWQIYLSIHLLSIILHLTAVAWSAVWDQMLFIKKKIVSLSLEARILNILQNFQKKFFNISFQNDIA